MKVESITPNAIIQSKAITIHLTIVDSITLNFYSTQSMKKLRCCAEARWQIHALKREQRAIKTVKFHSGVNGSATSIRFKLMRCNVSLHHFCFHQKAKVDA